MKNRMTFKILASLVVFCMISSICLNVMAYDQSDKQKLQDQKSKAQSEKKEITANKNEAQDDLNTINGQITTAESELEELKGQLMDVNDQIDGKQKDIEQGEKDIKDKNELLKQRLVALYEAGDTSFLDVLLSSDDLIDFLSQCSVIQTITETDTKLINDLEDKKTKLESDKQELETNKQKVVELKGKQEIKNASLNDLKDKKKKEVAKLSSDEQAKQSEIDSYDKQMKAVDDDLARKAKEAAEKIKKAQETAKKSGSSSSSSGVCGVDGLKFDGSFIWPCKSKTVISGMKKRWGRWHKGIDINANFESVYAAASGIAFNETNPGGYGTYVMVFHGNGYVTLYGHLSASHVSDGQFVKQGQVIATSGNSGNGVTHLHFEIRKASSFSDFFGNNWLNPLNYLPGGYTLAAGALTES